MGNGDAHRDGVCRGTKLASKRRKGRGAKLAPNTRGVVILPTPVGGNPLAGKTLFGRENLLWRGKPTLGGKTYFGRENLLWAGKPTLERKTYFGEENLLWRGKPTLGGETPFGRGNPLCVGKPLVGKPPLRRETPCRETPFGRGNPAPTCPSPQFFSLALRSQLARFTFTIPSGV